MRTGYEVPSCETGGYGERRVLIYRLGSLGDTLVALPALHLVARAFPDAERRLLTNFPVSVKAPPAAAVLDGTGLVHGYFRYAVGTRSVVELARLWWTLWRWRPEVLVYLGAARGVESARRDAQFFRLCGVKRMVGVPVTEAMQENFYGESVGDGVRWMLEPEAARLARNIGGAWGCAAGGCGELGSGADVRRSGRGRRRRLGQRALALPMIAVSVGTKVQAKDWGRENWRALLGRLA